MSRRSKVFIMVDGKKEKLSESAINCILESPCLDKPDDKASLKNLSNKLTKHGLPKLSVPVTRNALSITKRKRQACLA